MLSPDKKQTPANERGQQSTEQQQPRQDIDQENENVAAAYEEATKDIEADPENATSPNDDLDEGESARLGENTALI